MKTKIVFYLRAGVFSTALVLGCRNDKTGGIDAEYVGDPCTADAECYPRIDVETLSGPPRCLSEVENGYCTHECAVDEDCCRVTGECITDLEQVCAPLESLNGTYCFVTCEDAQGEKDADSFCQEMVHPDFHCRSTGGGNENRKVCLPN